MYLHTTVAEEINTWIDPGNVYGLVKPMPLVTSQDKTSPRRNGRGRKLYLDAGSISLGRWPCS